MREHNRFRLGNPLPIHPSTTTLSRVPAASLQLGQFDAYFS